MMTVAIVMVMVMVMMMMMMRRRRRRMRMRMRRNFRDQIDHGTNAVPHRVMLLMFSWLQGIKLQVKRQGKA